MSEPEEASITCEACGHVQPFVLWRSLNVTLDMDRKQELLDHTLTSSTCEACGTSASVVYPLLYHDMGQKLMIWLWPEPGDPDYGDTRQFRIMKGYRFRIVRTINELVEKILVFDQNCDDREVELFKFLVRAQHRATPHPLDGALYFRSTRPDEQGNDVIEFLHVTEIGAQTVDFPLREYRDAVALLRHDFTLEEPKRGTWLRVDAGFVQALVTRASQQPTDPNNETGDPVGDDVDEPF